MEEEMKKMAVEPVMEQKPEMEVEMSPEMLDILAKHFGVELAELGNYILTQLKPQEGEMAEEEKMARSMFPSLNQ